MSEDVRFNKIMRERYGLVPGDGNGDGGVGFRLTYDEIVPVRPMLRTVIRTFWIGFVMGVVSATLILWWRWGT